MYQKGLINFLSGIGYGKILNNAPYMLYDGCWKIISRAHFPKSNKINEHIFLEELLDRAGDFSSPLVIVYINFCNDNYLNFNSCFIQLISTMSEEDCIAPVTLEQYIITFNLEILVELKTLIIDITIIWTYLRLTRKQGRLYCVSLTIELTRLKISIRNSANSRC